MRKSHLALLLLLSLFFVSLGQPAEALSLAGPTSVNKETQALIDKYRSLIPQVMREQRIPGMAVAIVDDAQVLWAEGFGYTDWDRAQPVTVDTPFSIQSMSKSFTAAAVMLAVQEGLVDLDTPVREYLPDFHVNSIFEARPQDKITLRHLLSHTAGFTHDAPVGNNNDVNPGAWHDHIASISDTWLLFPVGTRYNYSNNGIDLAAYIIEARAGVPFQQYVKTHLLEPLGMTHSTFDIDAIRALPGQAIGHSLAPDIPLVQMMPSGGMYTSAGDMARYLLFYLNLGKAGEKQVLREDLLKTMYEGHFPASAGQGYGLGLGYSRARDASSTLQIEHGGGGFGFLSDMAWYPQIKFGVVWLSNSGEHDLQSWLTGQIVSDYIDANRETLSTRAYQSQPFTQKSFGPQDPATLSDDALAALIQSKALPAGADDANRLQKYTGTYGIKTWGRTSELHRVRLNNGALTLDGDPLSEVQPGLFFFKNGEVLDLRGPVYYYRNTRLDKIGQGTVIFYTLFVVLCALACLALLVWYPVRWIGYKVRSSASAAPQSWPARLSGAFILLGALVGLALFAGLVKFPFLVLDGLWIPHPGTPLVLSLFLLSPYILLALTLVAAVFTGLGWKGRANRDRWIDAGMIALLAVYALVVI
ncbi:MAG TPA: serine hydrolase domain-containing protein [Anaerolineales bacterium]